MKIKILLPALLLLTQFAFTQITKTSSVLGDAVPVTKTSLSETSMDFGEYQTFPNPAQSYLVLNAPNGKQKMMTINTVSGKKVKEMELNGASAIMDVSMLPAGMYVLKVRETDSDKTYQTKIVKQ